MAHRVIVEPKLITYHYVIVLVISNLYKHSIHEMKSMGIFLDIQSAMFCLMEQQVEIN